MNGQQAAQPIATHQIAARALKKAGESCSRVVTQVPSILFENTPEEHTGPRRAQCSSQDRSTDVATGQSTPIRNGTAVQNRPTAENRTKERAEKSMPTSQKDIGLPTLSGPATKLARAFPSKGSVSV